MLRSDPWQCSRDPVECQGSKWGCLYARQKIYLIVSLWPPEETFFILFHLESEEQEYLWHHGVVVKRR